MDLCILAGASI